MLNKRIKFLGILVFIIGLAITMTACDMNGNGNGVPETDLPDIDSITTEQPGVNAFATYEKEGEFLLYFQAREIGKEVNESIEIHFNADEENQELEVEIEENAILEVQVYLATDDKGESTSTASEVADEVGLVDDLMVVAYQENEDEIIEGDSSVILAGGTDAIIKVEWTENVEENTFNFMYIQYAHGDVEGDYVNYAEVFPEVENEDDISYLNFGGLMMYEIHHAIGELRLIVEGEQKDVWHYQDEEEPTWEPGAHPGIE